MPKREWTDEQRAEASRKARERHAKSAERAERPVAESGGDLHAAPPLGDPRDANTYYGNEPLLAASGEAMVEKRRRLLGHLPADVAALISDEDLDRIEGEERASALADRKKQALADVRATLRQRAKVEYDLIPANVLRTDEENRLLSEKIEVLFNLPDGAARDLHGFRVDGALIRSGEWTRMTRAQYRSLLPNYYNTWLNEFRFSTLNQTDASHSAKMVMHNTVKAPEVRDAA